MLKIIEINPGIRADVEANNGYCPCAIRYNEDTKCMCKDFREQIEPGECYCGRFEKVRVHSSNVLSQKQCEWAYQKWCERYTIREIADALNVCRRTIDRVLKGRERIRPALKYDEE